MFFSLVLKIFSIPVRTPFLNVSINSPGSLNYKWFSYNSIEFLYPCSSSEICTPYEVTLAAGDYRLECYGGSSKNNVRGAYTSGDINIKNILTLYLYIGPKEWIREGYVSESFNGGGAGYMRYSLIGAGATDIRLIAGHWKDFESLKSRVMVVLAVLWEKLEKVDIVKAIQRTITSPEPVLNKILELLDIRKIMKTKY